MSAISDQELLDRYARSRDDADFRPLVVRYAPLVYRACLSRLRHHDLAEDASQAVFILLAEKAGKIRAGASLVTWLLSASRMASLRVSRQEHRRRSREEPLDERVASADGPLDSDLVTALERLRGDERDAIVLSVLHGLTYAEVGERLGVSEDAARMRVRRGLDRLREKLAPLATVSPALLDRLSAPSKADARLRLSTDWRFFPMSYGYLAIAPIGLALLYVGFVVHPGGVSAPADRAPQASPGAHRSTREPLVRARPKAGAKRAIQFHFEEYFGKDPAWFEGHFGAPGPADGYGGGQGGERGALQWRTYPRRPSLGGGQGRMANATYTITEGFGGQVLSITFDGPVGGQPVATHVAHGVEMRKGWSLDKEASYVGISMGDYRPIPSDGSYPEGTRLFVNKRDPSRMVVANYMNGCYQIELDAARQ